ncbi:killer cell lectin-like receptor subfamily I member 2 isoform X2 [Grammomys surdaster]|uniref:killer cell lectin-like receptor subfamily I member 2 isoform X2 n=1 Tax=Grammomys surdaster TaxID=491861 RepID=UPI00109FFE72|nr:killer cell lectin-like receptor subfamily I member 2 isoform X2 [Grammomys surdaster]
MHKKRQNEPGTIKQEIINIGTESFTFQEKQRPLKTDQRSTVWKEEQKKQELKVLRAQLRTGFNTDKGTDPWLTTWQMITVILGISCIILVTKVGLLIPSLFSRGENQSREISLLNPLRCNNDDSSCDLCSCDWIAFGNHFYHIFHGTKTWAESQSACEELNSHLVIIDSEEELGGFFSKRMEPTGPGYGEMTVKHSTP